MRTPPTISARSRIVSRSRKQYQNIEIAPSSSAAVASHTRCDWIRFSSQSSIRIHTRLRRDLDVEQLLDREHERELVGLVAEVVHPGRVRNRLPPRLLLHVLLERGVQVADRRREADDLLAVQLGDQAQHAVGRRMVRAEVDLEQLARLAQRLGHLQHGRDRRGDPRSLVHRPRRLGRDRHYSSPEKRTGSPPIG